MLVLTNPENFIRFFFVEIPNRTINERICNLKKKFFFFYFNFTDGTYFRLSITMQFEWVKFQKKTCWLVLFGG